MGDEILFLIVTGFICLFAAFLVLAYKMHLLYRRVLRLEIMRDFAKLSRLADEMGQAWVYKGPVSVPDDVDDIASQKDGANLS